VQTEILIDESLDGIAMVVRNDGQWAHGISLESIDGRSRVSLALVGDFREPVPSLTVHIVQIAKLAQCDRVRMRAC